MGYYTHHEITIKTGNNFTIGEIAAALRDKTDSDFLIPNKDCEDTFRQYVSWSDNECKWYDEVDEMKEVSKSFPGCSFIIYGEGEDRDDVWEHTYVDGICVERMRKSCWGDPVEI